MVPPRSNFSATQWTVVLAAGGSDSHAYRALSLLCERYWDPLYAFVRRGGLSPEDAEDSVQGFFQDLLERQALTQVDRSKGLFRSFLLASFKNFLSHQRVRAQAQKRGGGRAMIELDARRRSAMRLSRRTSLAPTNSTIGGGPSFSWNEPSPGYRKNTRILGRGSCSRGFVRFSAPRGLRSRMLKSRRNSGRMPGH
jgi:hypothetical protein